MAIQKFTPQNSDQFLGKDQGDHSIGKFGHLNYLLKLVNAATLNFSPGSIIFSNSLGAPTADPTQLHWDDANNRLGIGNAAPTEQLDVTGNIKYSSTLYTPLTTGSIPFIGASGALSQNNSNLFWDSANSRLGIGTNAPSQKLHVVGTPKINTGLTVIDFQNNDDAIYGLASSNSFVRYTLKNSNAGISSAAGCLFYNDVNSILQMFQASSVNSNNPNKAVIRGSGAALVMLSTGYLQFNTGSGYGTEKMRVHSTGNVSIANTTDAGYKLDVNGNTRSTKLGIGTSPDLTSYSFDATGISRMYQTYITGFLDIRGSSAYIQFYNSAFLKPYQQPLLVTRSYPTASPNTLVLDNDTTGGAPTASTYKIIQSKLSGTEVMSVNGEGGGYFATSTPVSSAILQADSTTKGFLPPRMTGAQVEAIASPAEGLMAYATSAGSGAVTSKGWWGYNGTTWVKLN